MSSHKQRQYAAIPWRHTGAGLEVMLISSRETMRWVIPKGWRNAGLAGRETAAREAYEEAGVGGRLDSKPLGHFEYEKKLSDGSTQRCEVTVFGLESMIQHPSWPEQGQRTLRWFPLQEAANAVQEPGLARLIRKLDHAFSRR